jgi:outer membrane protein OmpA-like peptidoglycan-associated protein
MAGAALVISGCATVKQDQFDAEMAQVRQEIRQGDETVERQLGQRIDETERRLEARMATLEQALGQLRDEFDVTVERLETAIRFNAPVHFAFDDDQVRTQDREVLDRFASVVQAHYGQATITVEGFTDSLRERGVQPPPGPAPGRISEAVPGGPWAERGPDARRELRAGRGTAGRPRRLWAR